MSKIEGLADRFASTKTMDSIKRAAVQGIPRQAVLKPSHAAHRLVGQEFKLGDRVVMVQDSAAGGVPLALKGVVVGISSKDIDVVWDRPFMGGETLGGRYVSFKPCKAVQRDWSTDCVADAPSTADQSSHSRPA